MMGDSVVSFSIIQEAFAALDGERTLLKQLLYRNHNQHRTAKAFSCLKTLVKTVELLRKDDMNSLVERVELSIRNAVRLKLTSAELHHICSSYNALFSLVELSSTTVMLSMKTAVHLQAQLRKRVFVPLYTMLFASVARICNFATTLLSSFDSFCSMLKARMKVYIY